MRTALALSMLLALAACSSPEPADDQMMEVEPGGGTGAGAEPLDEILPSGPTAADRQALLESRDCDVVAGAFADTIARRDFAFAVSFWNDPSVDSAQLGALFEGYERPLITFSDMTVEGGAGSLYCTLTAELVDAADPASSPREGTVLFRRVNDVDGATAAQLRWHIEGSTLMDGLR